MILISGQNSALQKVCVLPELRRGEVNRATEVQTYASSKGPNAARSLACMGKEGLVLGYAGGLTGRLFQEDLRREGIKFHLTPIEAETRVCTTFAEPGGPSTEVIEPSPEVSPAERGLFQEIFRQHIDEARLCFICGTTVRGESEDCYARIISEAHRRGTPVLLDASGLQARRALRESPEILKVNRDELAGIADHEANDPASRLRIYRRLACDYGIKLFFTSLGAEGMEAFDGTRFLLAAAPRVRVINTIGSGDAASAGIGLALEETLLAGAGAKASAFADCLEKALLTGTAMGTANCLNTINGKVVREDYLSVRERLTIREVPSA